MVDVLVENPISTKSPLLIELQEGNKLWSSEENVQLWINNINEDEFSEHTTDGNSPTKNCFDGDVFLQLPGEYPDDLVLGAEAKHYGHLSPRISPLCSFDNNDKEVEESLRDGKDIQDITSFEFHPSPDQHGDPNDIDDEGILDQLHKRSSFKDGPYFVPEEPPLKVSDFFSGSLDSADTFSSFASSYDRPSSLAAALRADPEELLYSLGFGEQHSLLQTIPSRFFLNESEAYGIDVAEIHMSLLLEDEEKSVASGEPDKSNPLLHRFSESSIDLQSLASNDSSIPLNAKSRRILFKSSHKDIPSIHLTGDEDRPLSSPTSTSSGANRQKLETLEEVPEPGSRGSSFELDKNSVNTLSSIINATMQKVRTKLETTQHMDVVHRKSSDTNASYGGTLVDEEDQMSNILNLSQDDANNLNAPTIYRRCNSDKSVSSVATVIEQAHYIKSQQELERNNSTRSATDFQPIHASQESQNESLAANEETRSGNISPSLSAANRRSLFSSSRRVRAKVENDNVFQSNDSPATSLDPMYGSKESDLGLARNGPKTLDEIRRASPNTSFRDFIKQLAAETSPRGAIETGSQEATKAAQATENKKNLTEKNVSPTNKIVENHIKEVPHETPQIVNGKNDDVKKTQIDDNGTKVLPAKKGYFSSALDSISNVFNKYNDSKQSKCADDIDGTNHPENSSPSWNKNTSLFKLFSHQTLPVHSNSAFCTVATGLTTGEIELDPIHQCTSSTPEQLRDSKSTSKKDLSSGSDTKNQRQCSSSPASPASEDFHWQCPSSNSPSHKRKEKNSRPMSASRRSLGSSGISEDQSRDIKCPLGKNCSLTHLNGQHVNPANNESTHRLSIKTNNDSSVKRGVNGKNSENASAVARQPITHDHFDYLVQQIIAIRGEIKEEFEQSAERENNFKAYMENQMEEIKKVMSSEYMGWIANEMQQLKIKLQEKDEEIRRLRDVIIENNSRELPPFTATNGTEV